MKQNTVKFVIPPGGGITMEVIGAQGEDCTKITEELELHLSKAGEHVDGGKKPEYYEGPALTDVFNNNN